MDVKKQKYVRRIVSSFAYISCFANNKRALILIDKEKKKHCHYYKLGIEKEFLLSNEVETWEGELKYIENRLSICLFVTHCTLSWANVPLLSWSFDYFRNLTFILIPFFILYHTFRYYGGRGARPQEIKPDGMVLTSTGRTQRAQLVFIICEGGYSINWSFIFSHEKWAMWIITYCTIISSLAYDIR